ncbi:hypothetical protein ACGF12_31855 [Kitasatospora sp. NPDC048296]|jgi:hypothetical protein|uniref:hypothetical protein n=1 Tax=Kitasatospora sp. NPDC048296 TaxID=3364048 RepID=UPI00371C83DA
MPTMPTPPAADRPRRPCALLPAVLAVTLPLVGAPLTATAGMLIGGAVHQVVPADAVPGAVAGMLVRRLGAGVARTYAR